MNPQTQFLAAARHLAFYGLKRSGEGYAHDVLKGLRRLHPEYVITAIHPEADEVGGLPAVRSASRLRPAADSAIVVLKPARAAQAIDDAAQAGVRRIWLAMNAHNETTRRQAQDRGLTVVNGCPLLFMPDQELPHRIHRWLAQVFRRI